MKPLDFVSTQILNMDLLQNTFRVQFWLIAAASTKVHRFMLLKESPQIKQSTTALTAHRFPTPAEPLKVIIIIIYIWKAIDCSLGFLQLGIKTMSG